MFDYFYGAQAEQFSFYRVPKVLFEREQFRDLSPGEKHFKKCQNDTAESVLSTSPEVSKRHGINTNNNYTDLNNTYPVLSGCDEERTQYEEYFRKSLDIDLLLQDNPYEEEAILGILDLMVDVVCSSRQTIRIAGDDESTEAIKSRFMKLDHSHMEYILHCLHENTPEVRNWR